MIQGGGPRRSSPKRHNGTGQIRRQRITITIVRIGIIYPRYIEGGKQSTKHTNNPYVQGARTQDIQHDAGHPNSPTIHQVHASVGWSEIAPSSAFAIPSPWDPGNSEEAMTAGRRDQFLCSNGAEGLPSGPPSRSYLHT